MIRNVPVKRKPFGVECILSKLRLMIDTGTPGFSISQRKFETFLQIVECACSQNFLNIRKFNDLGFRKAGDLTALVNHRQTNITEVVKQQLHN